MISGDTAYPAFPTHSRHPFPSPDKGLDRYFRVECGENSTRLISHKDLVTTRIETFNSCHQAGFEVAD